MRLATMKSSTKVRSAGPGHATKPSPPRKRRRLSRFSSACRSWSLPTKSKSCSTSFFGLTILNPKLVKKPGRPGSSWSGRSMTRRSPPMTFSAISSLTCIGRFWWMSTGLPKVISDAMPSLRR